ncbi:unnamed protein product, partial [Mesorhabditis belari]|uniref:Oxysterol-binding protein n=1 Tax=Mesorhabditis belari TaxID=2138241 RepID=A0AAF3F220_9BILA
MPRLSREPPLPDYPAERCPEGIPPPVTGMILLKERNKRWKRSRRFYAELNRGYLKAWKNKKQKKEKDAGANSIWSTKIDIGSVVVVPEASYHRFHLQFSNVTQILTPLDGSTFTVWRDGIKNHRLYRQEGRKDGGSVSPPQQEASSGGLSDVPDETDKENRDKEAGSSPISGNQKIHEGLEATARVMDEAKEMFTMSLDVASTLVRTAEKLTSVQKEMKQTVQELRLTISQFKPTIKGKQPPSDGNEVPPGMLRTARLKSPEDDDAFEDARDGRSQVAVASLQTPPTAGTEKEQIMERIRLIDEVIREAEPSPVQPQLPAKDQLIESPPLQKKVPIFGVARQRRSYLPAKMMPAENLGMGAIAKMAFGRAGLPISHFEPLSMIQVVCEELRFASLLSRAAQMSDPVDRMAMIAAFTVSGYSNTLGRSRKPFNPILGETFDYTEPEWRFHGEQVSHHPPITAGFAEGNGWVWWQTMDANAPAKITAVIEVNQPSPVRVKLATNEGEENYSAVKVKTIIENATNPDKRQVSYLGKLRITSTNGLTCELHFLKGRELRGDIFRGNVVCCQLSGHWDQGLTKIETTGQQTQLFQVPQQSDELIPYYGFNPFTVTLNEPATSSDNVPSTDSRYRPDQRALEDGQAQQASQLKKQLEEAQRARSKTTYTPFWFEKRYDAMTQKQLYSPNMKYWPEKERQFAGTNFIDIFPCK